MVTDRNTDTPRGPEAQPRRVGSPASFGWLMLLKGSDLSPVDLWEAPSGEQVWFARGVKLERTLSDHPPPKYIYEIV